MSKRLWKCFTKSIICLTSELNDNRKNLHDSALKTKRLKNVSSTNLHLFDNRSINQVRKRLFTWSLVNTSISTMYELTISYWHSSNCHSIEEFNRSFVYVTSYSFFVFYILFSYTSMKCDSTASKKRTIARKS